MFRKVQTGTVNITEVEDDEDDKTIHTSSSFPASSSSGKGTTVGEMDGSEDAPDGRADDKKALINGGGGVAWRELLVYNRWMHIVYLLLLGVLLGLVIPYILASFAFPAAVYTDRGLCALNISYRFECLPGREVALTESECHALGCCYDHNFFDLYAPTCFHSIPSEYGYSAANISTSDGDTSEAVGEGRSGNQLRRFYRLSDNGEITLHLEPFMKKTTFGTESWSLRAKIQRGGDDVVRVLIYSPEHDYLEDDFIAEPATSHQLNVTVTQDPGGDFNITVTRVATGEEVLETVFGPMIYGRNYTELTTRLPTKHIYGLGLRRNFDFAPNFSHRERWPLFTEERMTMVGNVSVASGSSGAHPFYMNFERTQGYMYGLYLKTSAPVEVGLLPVPAVVFRGVGTLWDLRIMAGPTPRDVSRQYTGIVGRPVMPPYWVLGYHLCRAGASDLRDYDKVVEGMKEAQIPYESDCIDARLNYPYTYANLSTAALQRVEALKREGRKFILAQYPFVVHGTDAFNDSSSFLLKHNDSTHYYGSIEKLPVGYPDYADLNTLTHWLSSSPDVQSLYRSADGVFLLHNTPLNQAPMDYDSWNGTSGCTPNTPNLCCPDPALPFLPLGVKDINNHSVCVSVTHPSFSSASVPHLHFHNSYGLHHHRRIHSLMRTIAPNTRAFVSSQSTHPGSGAEGAAFGESFGANFMEQQVALVQVLELGLAGVPLAGLPVCGSRNDSVDEVRSEWCLRGHQMTAFWPLMVSHYEYGHQPRNPTHFDKSFTNQLAVFVNMRYALLPYMYTLLYEAHQFGTPLARPLFYEFPEDAGSRGVATQFMLGAAMLVSPVLQSVGSRDSVNAQIHFPPGRWYNFFSGALVAEGENGTDSMIPTLLADINLHLRGGAIVPIQGNLHEFVPTTEASRKVPFTLIVALSSNESTDPQGLSAEGSIYLDDGVTPLDPSSDLSAEHVNMWATEGQLNVTRSSSLAGGLCSMVYKYSSIVSGVTVFGVSYPVGKVTVNGNPHSLFKSNEDTGAVTITHINFDWCLSPSLLLTWEP